MPEAEYHIPVRRGHSARLRFWFDPISEEILAGNADLPIKDELSCSNPASKRLLLPLISRNFEGVFYFKNELNLIPMKDIEKLTADLNACADLRTCSRTAAGPIRFSGMCASPRRSMCSCRRMCSQSITRMPPEARRLRPSRLTSLSSRNSTGRSPTISRR